MHSAARLQGALWVVERRGAPLEAFRRGEGGTAVLRADNVVTDTWYNNLLTQFLSYAGMADTPAGYLSPQALVLGDGSGSPVTVDQTDTALVNETHRYEVIHTDRTAPDSSTLSFFAPASEATYNVKEAGLMFFGGAAPSFVVGGGGLLMTHLAFVYVKPSSEDVRFDYVIGR